MADGPATTTARRPRLRVLATDYRTRLLLAIVFVVAVALLWFRIPFRGNPLLLVGYGLLGFGALFALGAAWTWAAGTIYLKWAEIDANPLAITTWQLLIGFAGLAVGMFITEGLPQLSKLPLEVYGLLAYTGFVGLGLCYFAWFVVVKRLPAITASLGTLLVPVVGVIAASLVVGENPTLNDLIGFGLIFAAAICVLL